MEFLVFVFVVKKKTYKTPLPFVSPLGSCAPVRYDGLVCKHPSRPTDPYHTPSELQTPEAININKLCSV
jgi:hypothetical protein